MTAKGIMMNMEAIMKTMHGIDSEICLTRMDRAISILQERSKMEGEEENNENSPDEKITSQRRCLREINKRIKHYRKEMKRIIGKKKFLVIDILEFSLMDKRLKFWMDLKRRLQNKRDMEENKGA